MISHFLERDTGIMMDACDQDLARRQRLYNSLMRTHPDRIPIVVKRLPGSRHNELADVPHESKYLVPRHFEWAQVIWSVRARLSLRSDQGVIFFIDKLIPSPRALISDLHARYADSAGFIQCSFGVENVFGNHE